jgi:hypothetical protein
VKILADPPGTGLAVDPEKIFEFREKVGLRPEVAECVVTAGMRLGDLGLHPNTVVAVKAVALDVHHIDALAAEDLLESAHHRGGAGT